MTALVALAGNPAAASEPAAPPRLMGIVIAGPERIALFAGEPTLLVREGDTVGGERVTAIDARTVQLEGPAGRRSVRPSADPSARAEQSSTMPAPPLVDPYRRERETENDQ